MPSSESPDLRAQLERTLSGSNAIERDTLRKVSRRLLPILFLLFVVSLVDRTDVSLAALQMNRDLGLSDAVYGLGAVVFFVGYALFEVPSDLILVRVGARRWLARIAVTWGLLAAAMLFVRGQLSFYALRFLLGLAEAGFVPGVIYYLGQWFPERQRAGALALFWIGIPLSGVIGGPLGGALLGLDGRMGLAGWQWLFLLEGIPAVVLGVAALAVLSDGPDDARWLTPVERSWLGAQLVARRHPAESTTASDFREGLTSGTVWLLTAPPFLLNAAGFGALFWAPVVLVVLKEVLRTSDQQVGLVIGLLAAAGVAGVLLNGAHSDRTNERLLHATVPLLVAALGIGLAATLSDPLLVVLGFAVAGVGNTAFAPAFFCIPSLFLRRRAAAAGIAIITSVGAIGGFVGPLLVGTMKTGTGSFRGGLLALAVMEALAAVVLLAVGRRCGLAKPAVPAAVAPGGA